MREKTLFDDIEIDVKRVIKEAPEKTCINCEYYLSGSTICNDKEWFVDKNEPKKIVCRYNKNAIKFSEVYS